MTPRISLRSVTKRFLGHTRRLRPLYRELLLLRVRQQPGDDVAALSNLTLRLEGPSAVALLGPNGAGKSTLLRVIAGIYRRYEGEVDVRGRVACFFGAKAGSAPALSVIDNVFVQAAINGMTRAETRASVDEILAFAELEDHPHTRVEHLSFGMRQRLFFSITLQTMRLGKADIYLFDEWLAGADSRFCEKVESALAELRDAPHMVVYASHNLSHLRRACDKAVFLKAGEVQMVGDAAAVLDAYVEEYGGTE